MHALGGRHDDRTRIRAVSAVTRVDTVGGLRIHTVYATRGNAPEPSVVLVHGLVPASRCLVPLVEALARRGWSTYAPDLPGFGRSSRLGGLFGVDALARHLGAWADAVGVGGAAFVGVGFGSRVAAALAAAHPEMVSRLVLLGAGARPPVSMFVVPGANRRLGLGDVMASGPRRAWGTWRELRRDDLSARMERVTSPTLVARGSHDERWCAAEARSLVRRCTDGTYVEVAGTGPAAPVVHPDAVADTVTAFLRQH